MLEKQLSGFWDWLLGLSVAVFSQMLIDELLPGEMWDKLTLGLVLLTVLLIMVSILS